MLGFKVVLKLFQLQKALEIPFEFQYHNSMKNKNTVVYMTESEESEELANNVGEFVDWLFDFISEQEIKYGNSPKLFNVVQEFRDAIQDKLDEE